MNNTSGVLSMVQSHLNQGCRVRRNSVSLSLALALVLPMLAFESSAQDVVLDEIAVIVNNGVVLRSDIEQETEFLKRRAQSINQNVPDTAEMREQIVERLIDREIQRQRARDAGISVDASTINRAIERVASENNMNTFQFREQLQREGFDFQYYRDTLAHELLLQRLVQREVENTLNITEKEINDFMANQKKVTPEITRYRLQHILIAAPVSAPLSQRELARQQARLAINRFSEGERFDTIAREVSDGPRAANGGDLGWREIEELPLFITDNLPDLKRGDISDPIESEDGYHVILVNNITGSENEQPGEDLRVRHIFISTSPEDTTQEARRLLTDLRERIVSGESFGDLAEEFSQDQDSNNNGGELPWLRAGQMPRQMEVAGNDLPTGTISQPFRSQFGWHIMEVLERRTSSGGRGRTEATRAIRSQKFEREVDNWRRRLRDEAFVEVL